MAEPKDYEDYYTWRCELQKLVDSWRDGMSVKVANMLSRYSDQFLFTEIESRAVGQ